MAKRPGRIVVYTAIFGGYDRLKPQPEIPGVDYVCFTDDPSVEAPPWTVVVERPRYPHPRMSAKHYKLFPHRVLPQHPLTVWVDGSVAIKRPDFPEVFLSHVNESGMALFPHPDRDSIYDEAEVSMAMRKYDGQPILEQVAHYRAKGYPAKNGLWACTVLARDARNARLRRLHRRWMRHNRRWSYQDQLSLPFLLWKMGIEPGVFPYNLWDNEWFDWQHHTSEL